jgi:hypothetical protein
MQNRHLPATRIVLYDSGFEDSRNQAKLPAAILIKEFTTQHNADLRMRTFETHQYSSVLHACSSVKSCPIRGGPFSLEGVSGSSPLPSILMWASLEGLVGVSRKVWPFGIGVEGAGSNGFLIGDRSWSIGRLACTDWSCKEWKEELGCAIGFFPDWLRRKTQKRTCPLPWGQASRFDPPPSH